MTMYRDPDERELETKKYSIYVLGTNNILCTESFDVKPSIGDLIELVGENYEVKTTLFRRGLNKKYTPTIIVTLAKQVEQNMGKAEKIQQKKDTEVIENNKINGGKHYNPS